MALALSDMDLLRQSVESVEPKEIFLKCLRTHEDSFRRRMINILGVDVKTVQPIYVYKNDSYTRKNAKNMFLFLDKDYKIMAYLKGSKWDSSWEGAEDYRKHKKTKYYRLSIEKDRDVLYDKAFHILMFEQKDLKKVKVKSYYHQRRKNMLESYRDFLCNDIRTKKYERFFNFKKKKYEHLNHDIVLFMSAQSLFKLAMDVGNKDSKIKHLVSKLLSNNYHYSKNTEGAIEFIANKINQFKKAYEKFSSVTEPVYNGYCEKEYLEIKFSLISIYNVVVNSD